MLRFILYALLGSLIIISISSAQEQEQEQEERSPRLSMSDIGKEILNRSTNSQVLSLNLTNLIILLVLKGLLFGATMIGHGHHKGRALDDEPLVTQSEIMLLTSYLMGDANKDYNCLYRVACQEPKKTKQYLSAAKLLIKAGKIFPEYLPSNEKHESLLLDIQDAINFGLKYNSCERFNCANTEKHKQIIENIGNTKIV